MHPVCHAHTFNHAWSMSFAPHIMKLVCWATYEQTCMLGNIFCKVITHTCCIPSCFKWRKVEYVHITWYEPPFPLSFHSIWGSLHRLHVYSLQIWRPVTLFCWTFGASFSYFSMQPSLPWLLIIFERNTSSMCPMYFPWVRIFAYLEYLTFMQSVTW